MSLFEYLSGLLTYKDTIDPIDYGLRTIIWVLIVFGLSGILSFLYHIFAIKEEKNKRRINMKVIVKNEIRKFNGTIAGPHWIPPIEFYEVDVQCPSSGFCFKINNKDLYNTCKIGDILDVEIVEVYSKIFFNPFEKDFLKFKITDFKKVSHE